MASPRQRRRDELARSRGFRNYYDYRNWVAKQQGYRSYAEQRLARKTGRGLRGVDVARALPRVQRLDPDFFIEREPSFRSARELTTFHRMSYQNTGVVLRELTLDRAGTPGFRTAVNRRIDGLDDIRHVFVDDLERIYLEGAKRGLGDRAYELTAADRRQVERLRKEAGQSLDNVNDFARRSALRVDQDMNKMPEILGIRPVNPRFDARKQAWLKKNGIKGRVYVDGQKRSLEDAGASYIDSNASVAYNRGTVISSRNRGCKVYEISDGPDCGLSSHDDTLGADGMLVSADDALRYPIAHPHCRRTFIPRWDLDEPPGKTKSLRERAEKAGLTKQNAAAAAAGVTALVGTTVVARQTAIALRSNPSFMRFAHALNRAVRLRNLSPDVLDIRTGRAMKVGVRSVAEEVQEDLLNWSQGLGIRQRTRQVLGVSQDAPRRVVGDAFQDWNDYYRLSFQNSMLGVDDLRTMNDMFGLTDRATQSFFEWIGEKGPGFARLSFPRLRTRRGLNRATRGTLKLGDMLNLKQTFRRGDNRPIRGLTDLNVNPNGLLRAGFRRDTENGLLVPYLRAIPKGPLRVNTKLNRSIGRAVYDESGFEVGRIGKGRVTSLSVELRLLTRGLPISRDIKAAMNINLRALGIYDLRDIRKLTLADFRRLKLDDVKLVSIASDLHFRGFNMFDFTKTFRVTPAHAMSLDAGVRFGIDAWRTLQPNGFDKNMGLFLLDIGRSLAWEHAQKIWLLGRQKLRVTLEAIERILGDRPDLRVVSGRKVATEVAPEFAADVSRLRSKIKVLTLGDETNVVDLRDLDQAERILRMENERLMREYNLSSGGATQLQNAIRAKLLGAVRDYRISLQGGTVRRPGPVRTPPKKERRYDTPGSLGDREPPDPRFKSKPIRPSRTGDVPEDDIY